MKNKKNIKQVLKPLIAITSATALLGGVFMYASFNKKDAEVASASAIPVAKIQKDVWTKTNFDLKTKPGEIKENNGEFYMCTDKSGFLKLDKYSLNWNKIAQSPKSCGNIEFTSNGDLYLLNQSSDWSGETNLVRRLNTKKGTWEPIITHINKNIKSPGLNRPVFSGFKSPEEMAYNITYGYVLGKDDNIYTILEKKSDNSKYVFKFDLKTKKWSQISKEGMPISKGKTEDGYPMDFNVTKPGIEVSKSGEIYFSNRQTTGVSTKDRKTPACGYTDSKGKQYSNVFISNEGYEYAKNVVLPAIIKEQKNPKLTIKDAIKKTPVEYTMPNNLVMKLSNGKWKNMIGKNSNLNPSGATCKSQWSSIWISFLEDGETLITQTALNFSFYDFKKSDWTTEEEYSYATNYSYQNSEKNIAIGKGGRPDSAGKLFSKDFILNLPDTVNNEKCKVVGVTNLDYSLENSLAVAQISTNVNDKCYDGYPKSSDVVYEGDFNKYISFMKSQKIRWQQKIERGVYVILLDNKKSISRSLETTMSSYIDSKAGVNETIKSSVISNKQIILAGRFSSKDVNANRDSVVVLDKAGKVLKRKTLGVENTYDMEKDVNGNIYIATEKGVTKYTKDMEKIVWQYSTNTKEKTEIAIDGDKIAVLNNKTVYLISTEKGTVIKKSTQFSNSYVEDIEYDAKKGVIYIAGFDNKKNKLPVQVAFVYSLNASNMSKKNTTWNYKESTLSSDMADTRIYQIALNSDKSSLYVSGETAGGNTIFRWNGKDLKTPTWVDSGKGSVDDMWMSKSASHLNYIGKINTTTGLVEAGTINASYLASDSRLNTTRVKDGSLFVDQKNNVYTTGFSSAHIPNRDSWYINGQRINDGSGSGYAGSDGYIIKLNPNLKSRDFWIAPSKFGFNSSMTTVYADDDMVVVGGFGNNGSAITTKNSLQAKPAEKLNVKSTNDAYFMLWNVNTLKK